MVVCVGAANAGRGFPSFVGDATRGDGVKDRLSKCLASARDALASSHNDAVQALSGHMEAHAQLEADLASLNVENQTLRERLRLLGSDVGGLGESLVNSTKDMDAVVGGGARSAQTFFKPMSAGAPPQTPSRTLRSRGLATGPRVSDTTPPMTSMTSVSRLQTPLAVGGVGVGGGLGPVADPTRDSAVDSGSSSTNGTGSRPGPAIQTVCSIPNQEGPRPITDLLYIDSDFSGEEERILPRVERHPLLIVTDKSVGKAEQGKLIGVVPSKTSSLGVVNGNSPLVSPTSSATPSPRGSKQRPEGNAWTRQTKVAAVMSAAKSGRDAKQPLTCEAPEEDLKKPENMTVLPDLLAMKAKVRSDGIQPQYCVENFYHKRGIWQAIARNPRFDNLTLAVIGFNAFWIMIDTDHNTADMLLEAEPIFQVAENFFCFYFSLEWLIRFRAFKIKQNCIKDMWFVFDSALVAVMLCETWGVTMVLIVHVGGAGGAGGKQSGLLKLFRLFRLSRMARMARLFRAMPELMIMIKGMAVAMRSVFFTLLLLLCIVYVFAIIFVQLCGPRGALPESSVGRDFFPDVIMSMNSLLLEGALPDQSAFVSEVGAPHPVMRILVMLYILLAGLTVMNMLVGVLCEVISVVSSVEKESLLVNFVKSELIEMISIGDTNQDRHISKEEFLGLLGNARATRALSNLGVDPVGLIDFSDQIFAEPRDLSFAEFMDIILQLRGSNTATVKDVVDLRKLIVFEVSKVIDLIDSTGTTNRKIGNVVPADLMRKPQILRSNSMVKA
eukprot:TRINITY_DN8483_c0_g1_i1.p1 TRINITY_DN8483_c0_g1~~TRINITY_DN8483_c0_g1_i1.p1  ORF type:complete len:781 (-),score=142.02 TRINITY_DN8483_c0_g1_i1:41-2383(-)